MAANLSIKPKPDGQGQRQLLAASVRRALPLEGFSEQAGDLWKKVQVPETSSSEDKDGLQEQSVRRAKAAPKEYVSLLTLPPELRNQIWREVLLSPGLLVTNPTSGALREPGLLRVSRTVRRETLGIYYMEIDFCCIVANFDHKLWQRWLTRSAFRAFRHKRQMKLMVLPSTDWPNLKHWAKDIRDGRCVGFIQGVPNIPLSSNNLFAAQLFKIVTREKKAGSSWEKVEERLEDARETKAVDCAGWRAA